MQLDLYRPEFLADVLTNIPDKPHFLRDKFFNKTLTFVTPQVLFDVYKGTRKMTPFVNPAAPAPQSDMQGYKTEAYIPAAVKEQRAVDAWQLQYRLMGEVVMNSGKTPETRAVELLARNIEDLKDNLQRREEWMASQVLFTGQIQVKGEDVDDLIDFGHDLKKSLNANQWNTAEADIFGDILSWQTEVQKKSGYRPNTLIADAATIDMILRNEKVLKLADNRNFYFGNNNYDDLGEGAAYCGRLGGQINVDLFAYDDYYEDPETGVIAPFIPKNTICLCNPAATFTKMYGAITYLERTNADDVGVFRTFEGDFRIDAYSKKNPAAQFVLIESRPIFVPEQIDSYLIATIA